jgi:hypothetical protein
VLGLRACPGVSPKPIWEPNTAIASAWNMGGGVIALGCLVDTTSIAVRRAGDSLSGSKCRPGSPACGSHPGTDGRSAAPWPLYPPEEVRSGRPQPPTATQPRCSPRRPMRLPTKPRPWSTPRSTVRTIRSSLLPPSRPSVPVGCLSRQARLGLVPVSSPSAATDRYVSSGLGPASGSPWRHWGIGSS